MAEFLWVLNLAVLLWLVFEVRTLRKVLRKGVFQPFSSPVNPTDAPMEKSPDPVEMMPEPPLPMTPISKEDEAIARKTLSLARQGVASAQCSLGKLYQKGLGLSPDPVQAAYWYEAASRQGHAEALFLLGQCRLEGNGVGEDEHEAESLFRRSAAAGWAESQFRLSQLLAGPGRSEKELAEARRWLDKAAQQGHLGARRVWADLHSITSTFRSEPLSAALSPVVRSSPWVPPTSGEKRKRPDSRLDEDSSERNQEAGKSHRFRLPKSVSNFLPHAFRGPLKAGALIVVWVIFMITCLFFFCATYDGL
ncbi:MAG: sel1 repeat family protein [Verrucomicrobia bacterium]|nr:sel1 repeat family protein [Verrucomicrobiota bacterium]